MESPRTAERLMTPAAVLIAVGGLTNPPHRWVLFVWRSSSRRSSLLDPRFFVISAADCNGRPREKNSLPDQDALGKENAP
jgi:hypothetical protein